MINYLSILDFILIFIYFIVVKTDILQYSTMLLILFLILISIFKGTDLEDKGKN
jgi:hypothetical protein